MLPQLVIFDCDGVLVDTEDIYFAMNKKFINEQVKNASTAAAFTFGYYEHFIGMASDLMWDEIRTKFNLRHSVEELIQIEKENKLAALQNAPIAPIDGVQSLIQKLLEKNVNLAVASSGRREAVTLLLAKSNLMQYFPVIVTGEDVMRGKPAPDIFLKAAQLSKAPAGASVVIEDSRNGILGAKAASMRAVGYINPKSGSQDLSKADLRVQSFNDSALLEFLSLT
ncbi:MAG TPA: HAD-IA family hydrolase [Turneriella sp.]|nr:HAD-IA family hydrolase [Turneriella sp.]